MRKPSIYGHSRFVYLLAQCLRALPAGLPANARSTRATEATGLKCPKDAGSRPMSHCAPLQPSGLCLTQTAGGLPCTPRKTGVSGGATRQPSVYAGSQPACLQSPYLRGFPAGLPANARIWRYEKAFAVPSQTEKWASGMAYKGLFR